MDLWKAINQFHYDMSLNELRMMHENMLYPNITYNSLLYLDLIVYKENCTASFLAQALHVSKSAVTLKVNELIRQGLVEKIQSPQDRRVYFLRVRPAIAEEYRTFDRQAQGAVEEIQKQFSKEELGRFCEILTAFSSYYGKEAEHA